MRRRGKLAVVALVALTALPSAYTFQQQPVVAGHATYAGMDGLDPCLASIVGVVRLRVMWFNDQVLFERTAEDGGSFVYATEHGAPDPRDQALTPTGEVFEFVDPNGMEWRIEEYTFTLGPVGNASGGEYGFGPGGVHADPPSADVRTEPYTYYAWVVQTGPTIEDYAATGRSYNFVTLVDTCKFHAVGEGLEHQRDAGGNWSSTWGNDTTEQAHLPQDGTHGHERYSVDLYTGQAPRIRTPQHDPDYLGAPQ